MAKRRKIHLIQARALIYSEESLPVGMLFGVGLTRVSDFGVGTGATQLTN